MVLLLQCTYIQKQLLRDIQNLLLEIVLLDSTNYVTNQTVQQTLLQRINIEQANGPQLVKLHADVEVRKTQALCLLMCITVW